MFNTVLKDPAYAHGTLEREIEKLKEIVVAQSAEIAHLKKETNWD